MCPRWTLCQIWVWTLSNGMGWAFVRAGVANSDPQCPKWGGKSKTKPSKRAGAQHPSASGPLCIVEEGRGGHAKTIISLSNQVRSGVRRCRDGCKERGISPSPQIPFPASSPLHPLPLMPSPGLKQSCHILVRGGPNERDCLGC